MKTLDDLILGRNGLWFALEEAIKAFQLGDFLVGYESDGHGCTKVILKYLRITVAKERFQQRAKELGFVGKYRWGVEYQTDGKKPDLADDVVVEMKWPSGDWHSGGSDELYAFHHRSFSSFKITDPRYKPQDTSYLDKTDLIGIDTASGKDESVDHVVHTKTTDTTIEFETVKVDDEFAFTAQDDSDWWDWQNDKMLRLPPVGERVSYSCVERDSKEAIEVGQWYCGTIIAYHCGYVWTSDNGIRALSNTRFRPLDHAARKAELEKKKLIEQAKSVCFAPNSQATLTTIECLIDAGWRPTKD